MKQFASTVLLSAVLSVCLFTACKKGEDTAAADAATPAAPKPASKKERELIPGENEVKAALAAKDYAGAVQQFVAMKAVVASPEQNEEYSTLYGQMRTELEDAARKDPKAAEALMSFRALRNGR
jgi:hypothetical protein